MRLVRFLLDGSVRPGALRDDDASVVDLSDVAQSMDNLVAGGVEAIEAAQDAAKTGDSIPTYEVRLVAPLAPASLRDFLAFEDHARAGAARRGEDLNPAW